MVRSSQKHFIESKAVIYACTFSVHLALMHMKYAALFTQHAMPLARVVLSELANAVRATIVAVRVGARLRQLDVGARLSAGPKVAAVRDAATSHFCVCPSDPPSEPATPLTLPAGHQRRSSGSE